MRRFLSSALTGLFGLLFLQFGLAQEERRSEGVKQPIEFNHYLHAESGLQCSSCHPTANSKDQAGIPGSKECLACHRKFQTTGATLRILEGYEKTRQKIQWVRIYQLPGFVFFSHQAHLKANADCSTCHGDVKAREVLWKEKEISMAACISCHKASNASTDCNLCHELNR
jgi:hypothetical protein